MKYFKNTSWMFLEKILRIIVGLFVGIWIARYLGPEQFGLLSYAQSIVTILAIFAALGLDSIVVREIVNTKDKNTILGTAFLLKFLGSLLTILLVFIVAYFFVDNLQTNLLLFIIASGTLFQTFTVIDFYFQAQVAAKLSVYANIVTLLVSAILKITLILLHMPLIYFAIALVVENICLSISYIIFYQKNNGNIMKWQFDKKIAKNMLFDALPFVFSAFAVMVYMKIDIIMIGKMLNSNAIGEYSVAVRLSEAWNFIPVVISASLFPAILRAKTDKKVYYNRLEKLYALMIWSAIFIALPISLYSHFIILHLFGDVYSEAYKVLQVHIWSIVFVFLLVASGKWLVSENLGKYALYRNLWGASINIVLNYFWISDYGILGAAYATLVSYAIAGLFYDLASKKLRENFYMKIYSPFLLNRIKNHYE